MSVTNIEKIRNTALKYALLNAISYNGKAQLSPVISRVIAELPDTKKFLNFFYYFKVQPEHRNLSIDLKVRKVTQDVHEEKDSKGYGVYNIGDKYISIHRKFGNLIVKNLGADYTTEILYSGFTDILYPLFNLIRDVIWFKLINKKHTLIHAAGIQLKGKRIIISGWLGSGKTMSSLLFIKEHKAMFLGDDLVIINDRGKVLPFPIPLKLSYAHSKILRYPKFPKNIKLLLGELIAKIPIIRRSIEIVEYTKINDILKTAKIDSGGKIDIVFVAKKAKERMLSRIQHVDNIVQTIFYQGFWERLYWLDRIFIHYSMAHSDFDLISLLNRERKIISNALDCTEIYEITYENYLYNSLLWALQELGLI